MKQFNIYEAKTGLSITVKTQEDKEGLSGCEKGQFEIPENFDDTDISEEFEGEIFPL